VSGLVGFLGTGTHPVALDRYAAGGELAQRIDEGYVLVKFTGTRGGTELGLRLDRARCDLSSADFGARTGNVRLVGNLVLDFVGVEVTADVDVATLRGEGSLQVGGAGTAS
jgi:hypothetical protein